MNQIGELVQRLKTFSLSDQLLGSKTANHCCISVISGAKWKEQEEMDGIARTGVAIKAAYHDTGPWQVSAGGFLASCCWLSFIGIKSYLERNVCKVP